MPAAVWVSYRLVLGTARRDDGAPARSKRLAIEGRNKDIVLCFTSSCSFEWKLGVVSVGFEVVM